MFSHNSAQHLGTRSDENDHHLNPYQGLRMVEPNVWLNRVGFPMVTESDIGFCFLNS